MVVSDFLSRQNNDDSDPHENIPIFFNMHKVLQENYYKIDICLGQTRFLATSGGIKLPRSSCHEKEFRSRHKTRKTT